MKYVQLQEKKIARHE